MLQNGAPPLCQSITSFLQLNNLHQCHLVHDLEVAWRRRVRVTLSWAKQCATCCCRTRSTTTAKTATTTTAKATTTLHARILEHNPALHVNEADAADNQLLLLLSGIKKHGNHRQHWVMFKKRALTQQPRVNGLPPPANGLGRGKPGGGRTPRSMSPPEPSAVDQSPDHSTEPENAHAILLDAPDYVDRAACGWTHDIQNESKITKIDTEMVAQNRPRMQERPVSQPLTVKGRQVRPISTGNQLRSLLAWPHVHTRPWTLSVQHSAAGHLVLSLPASTLTRHGSHALFPIAADAPQTTAALLLESMPVPTPQHASQRPTESLVRVRTNSQRTCRTAPMYNAE